MNELFNLGLSEGTIKSMMEMNNEIKDMSDKEIIEKIELLKKLNCSGNQISNIIGSNSMYLSRTNGDIINLVNKLYEFGFNTLNILFDSNPYILNLEPFEIEEYINKRVSFGEELSDIVDDLDSNPYLFSEM